MVVLFDANVALTFLLKREDPYRESVENIFLLLYKKQLEGCIAFHSLPVIYYVLRKVVPEDEKRKMLQNLCRHLHVVAASHEDVVEAINQLNFKDFEDCLQDKCAKTASADYIVTSNIKDFANSEIQALTPDELLDRISEGT